jgi:hypothetical protein
MSAESEELTMVNLKVISIAGPKGFQTLNIGLTGMVIWQIQTAAKTTVSQTINPT